MVQCSLQGCKVRHFKDRQTPHTHTWISAGKSSEWGCTRIRVMIESERWRLTTLSSAEQVLTPSRGSAHGVPPVSSQPTHERSHCSLIIAKLEKMTLIICLTKRGSSGRPQGLHGVFSREKKQQVRIRTDLTDCAAPERPLHSAEDECNLTLAEFIT